MGEDLSNLSMLELFRLEAEGQTAVLSGGVLAIEELQRSPKTIDALMRAAHSLKGAARIVGLDAAVRVAHALEDVFVAAGKGRFHVRPEHADLLLEAIDFLASIAHAVEEGRTVYDNLKKTVTFLLPINGGESMALLVAVGLANFAIGDHCFFTARAVLPALPWPSFTSPVPPRAQGTAPPRA